MSTALLKADPIENRARKRAQRGRPSTKNPQMPGTPKQWQCNWDDCPKSFGRKSDLIRHHHTHTGTRNHKCHFPGCGKTFIQTSALTVHIRTHTGEKPHECHMCNKRFSDSSSLARHRKIHSNDRPYPCKVEGCDKSFCRKSTLNKHLSREHPGVAHSPGTDDSDDEPSASSQGQGDIGFSNADQMSQHSSMSVQNQYAKGEMTFTANPSQYRRTSQGTRLASTDYYSQTLPSTPTVSHWQAVSQSRRQNYHVAERNSRVPAQLKNLGSLQYHDMGPMSAPIHHSEQEYHGQHSMPQTASFMPADYSHAYYQAVTDVPVTMYGQSDMTAGQIHPPMLPSNDDSHDDAQRVLQAQMKAEQLVSDTDGRVSMTQTPEIYAYTTQEYQEPVSLGVTTDHRATYQLPGSNFQVWGMDDDEKYQETFGEIMPGQALSQYSF